MPKVESTLTVYRGYLAERLLSRRIVRTKAEANQIMDALFSDIADVVQAGKVLRLNGFGTFQRVPTSERYISKHVKTGQPFTLPASHRIRFTPSRKLLAGDTA